MSFYNWQGPSGKIKTGTETHFVELMGTPHKSNVYKKLKGGTNALANMTAQAFIKERKIPATWVKIGKVV